MDRAYRFALILALVPFVVGVSISALWFVTRWDWLFDVGFVTLFGGVALVLLGLMALARYYGRSPQRNWRHALACLGLLLLDAFGIVAGANVIETRYTVVVHNASDRPLRGVIVTGGGVDEYLGILPSGWRVDRSFWVQQDGSLTLIGWCGSGRNEALFLEGIDGNVSSGVGGHADVTFRRDGTVLVVHHE